MRSLMLKNKLLVATSLTCAMRMPVTNEGGFDFPDTVDTLDNVPERARGLYEEKDGKFTFKGVDGLRNSLASSRSERDAANKRAKDAAAYAALGKSPDEIKALIDAESERATNKLKEEQDWKGLQQQMEENHTTALSEKDKVIDKLKKSLEKETIENGIQRALSDKDVEGNPLFLMSHMRGRVKLDETDEGYSLSVLRSDGTPMLNKDNKPASLKDLALELKGDTNFASAFKGVNQSGGGTSGTGGGGGTSHTNLSKLKMSPLDKVKFIREHGQDEYNRLPA